MSTKKLVPPSSPYDALSYREIQAECKRRGLKAVAKRDELSKSLLEDDSSPRKSLPKPSIPATTSSSLKTAYPPPTPPYSEDDEEEEIAEEKESTPQKSSPKKVTPKKTTTPSPRYPTPLKSPLVAYVEETARVPGWMLQLGAGLAFLLLIVLIFGSRSTSEVQVTPTFSKHEVESILRSVLSNYPSGENILEKIKFHQSGKALSLFLVGPTEKGLQIVNDIARVWPRYNHSKPLIVEKSDGKVISQEIDARLKKHPESIVVINTDKVNKENSNFLGMLLDDTIAGSANQAVIILLGDLFKDNQDPNLDVHEPTVVNKLLKSRFTDRVAQRIRNTIML